jgi:hypothetical protein
MINAATLQKKDELVQAMEQAEQQAQQAQMAQMQAEVQESQARTELAQARSIADRGLGLERASRVNENEQLAQERKSQAHKEDMEALLNFVKAAKEIEGLDFQHLSQLVSMQKIMKETELVGAIPVGKEPVASKPKAKTLSERM